MEALRAEMDIPSFATQRDRRCLLAKEIAERRPEDHPRRLALESVVKTRNQRNSWGRKSQELTKLLPEDVAPRLPGSVPSIFKHEVQVQTSVVRLFTADCP